MANITVDSCETVYPSRNNFSSSGLAVLLALNIILALLNIAVNSFLIFALKATGQLKNISCRLIMYLSLSDIGVGLVLQPLVSAMLGALHYNRNCSLELTGQVLSYIFPQISGVMVMIIASDRWLHMKYLNKYASLMNWQRARLMILVNLGLSLTIAAASIIASVYQKFFIFNAILVLTDFSVVILTYIAYISTFRSVRKHSASIRLRSKDSPSQSRASCTTTTTTSISKKTRRRDARLAKTMIFILTSLTACYVPYFAVGLYWSYLKYHLRTATSLPLDALLWVCFLLVYLNSSLNAMIFIRRNKKVYTILKVKLGFAASFDVSTTSESSGNQNTINKL